MSGTADADADNLATSQMNSPAVRYMERDGFTIVEELDRASLWSAEWRCKRKA